jgi:hypothetical protein
MDIINLLARFVRALRWRPASNFPPSTKQARQRWFFLVAVGGIHAGRAAAVAIGTGTATGLT